MAPTLSFRAIVPVSVLVPLNENAEVRAATCSSLISASELRSSSVSPSEKYSWSLSPLRFTNGSTAIECGGGLKAVDAARCFEIQNLSATKYASVARTTATIASRNGFDLREARSGPPTPGPEADTAFNGDSCGDSRRLIRSTKAAGVSPPGRRVHCTRLNDSGTSAATSVVASKHTGTTNTRLRAIMWVR